MRDIIYEQEEQIGLGLRQSRSISTVKETMPRFLSIPFNVAVLKSTLLNLFLFVPPENFDLALLTFELEFIKKGTKSEQIDAPQQSKQLRKRFANQQAHRYELSLLVVATSACCTCYHHRHRRCAERYSAVILIIDSMPSSRSMAKGGPVKDELEIKKPTPPQQQNYVVVAALAAVTPSLASAAAKK
ncbi:hypothetical protein HN873_043605 [Arachis hypogaea]